MAFPLTGAALTNSGVTVFTPGAKIEFNYTRDWEPIPGPPGPNAEWLPTASSVKINTPTLQKRFVGARTWSGAITESGWPLWGQGWPRVKFLSGSQIPS